MCNPRGQAPIANRKRGLPRLLCRLVSALGLFWGTESVIAVDRTPAAIGLAATRAESKGISDALIVEGDPTLMKFDYLLDAVAGANAPARRCYQWQPECAI
jgi:hypothetical protein